MPRDSVELRVNGASITNFVSYTVDADIYQAASAFSIDLGNWNEGVREGDRCDLYVNGQRELTGLIDGIERSYDKRGGTILRATGRDLMGLLVDSYCEQFVTTKGTTVQSMAESLLAKVPFIDRSAIVYEDIFAGKIKKVDKRRRVQHTVGTWDIPHAFTRVEPRMTVFQALKSYAESRGFMFFALPDGTMVFGKPKSTGDALFTLTTNKNGLRNNVLAGSEIANISRRYSRYRAIGQQQTTGQVAPGTWTVGTAASPNTGAYIDDPDFPYEGYAGPPIYKPFVTLNYNDYQSPALHCRMLMEKARHQGYQLHYRVQGHSQGGTNWQINQLARVRDEVLKVDGAYLIYGRAFEMSKRTGTITSLRLGVPGYIEQGVDG